MLKSMSWLRQQNPQKLSITPRLWFRHASASPVCIRTAKGHVDLLFMANTFGLYAGSLCLNGIGMPISLDGLSHQDWQQVQADVGGPNGCSANEAIVVTGCPLMTGPPPHLLTSPPHRIFSTVRVTRVNQPTTTESQEFPTATPHGTSNFRRLPPLPRLPPQPRPPPLPSPHRFPATVTHTLSRAVPCTSERILQCEQRESILLSVTLSDCDVGSCCEASLLFNNGFDGDILLSALKASQLQMEPVPNSPKWLLRVENGVEFTLRSFGYISCRVIPSETNEELVIKDNCLVVPLEILVHDKSSTHAFSQYGVSHKKVFRKNLWMIWIM